MNPIKYFDKKFLEPKRTRIKQKIFADQHLGPKSTKFKDDDNEEEEEEEVVSVDLNDPRMEWNMKATDFEELRQLANKCIVIQREIKQRIGTSISIKLQSTKVFLSSLQEL